MMESYMTEANTSKAERGSGVVFVATDLGTQGDEALRHGHARAAAQGAKLVVCHVVPNQMRVNMLFPQRTMDQADAHVALHGRVLQLLIERTVEVTGRSPEQFDPIVGDGEPYSVIVERAEQAAAEVIAIGGKHEAGSARTLLGNVAERVVRYAHCPVLIARPGSSARRILVATDLSDPSLPALGAAKREAARTGAPVTALYCVEPPVAVIGPEYGVMLAQPIQLENAAEVRGRAAEALASAAQQVGLEADQRVVEGSPASTILQTAKELDAALIVIGTRGRTGLRRMVLGSVAESVIHGASCSVLAVRLGENKTAAES
jgi:nucleotide-binding universal stress UspA family protein